VIVPDYVEPTVGWRVWHAVDDGVSTSLLSVVHKTFWPRCAPLEATCRCFRLSVWPFRRTRHEAPASGCTCGIYAANVETVRLYLPDHFGTTRRVPVIGRVALWGEVHEHEHGWRATYAYPKCLFVPVANLSSLAAAAVIDDLRRYAVPVLALRGTNADTVLDELTTLAA